MSDGNVTSLNPSSTIYSGRLPNGSVEIPSDMGLSTGYVTEYERCWITFNFSHSLCKVDIRTLRVKLTKHRIKSLNIESSTETQPYF